MKAEHVERRRQELLGDLRKRNRERLDSRPRLYQNAVADHPEVLKWIDAYGELFPNDTFKMLTVRARGNGLFLYGNPGSGKTYQALGIPAVLAARDLPAGHVFIRAVDYLDGQQNADFRDKEKLYREALDAQLLILDDLFAGGDHKRSASDLYRLLDARFIDERPVVMTCNLSGSALMEAMGERLVDRLRESAVYVKLAGNSRRKFRAVTAPASPEQRTEAPAGWWEN
jgi:DNA replication protein DnaC